MNFNSFLFLFLSSLAVNDRYLKWRGKIIESTKKDLPLILQAQQLTDLEQKLAVAKNELEKAALDRVSWLHPWAITALVIADEARVYSLFPFFYQCSSRCCACKMVIEFMSIWCFLLKPNYFLLFAAPVNILKVEALWWLHGFIFHLTGTLVL